MQAKSLLTVMLWLTLSGNAVCASAAASILGDNNRPAVRRFVFSAYDAYALAVKQHGVDRLQKITAPNFTMSLGGKTLQGKEAFAALEQPLQDLQNTVFCVSIPKITLTKTTAVALTVETMGRKLDAETTITTKQYWTQTWRKTHQGWKLEKSDQRPPQINGPSPIMTYVIGATPKTPLTINTSALGTDLGTPPTSGPVLDLYGPYLDAMRRHDEAAFSALLTPDFNFTDDGKVLSRQASLKLTGQIHGVMKEYPSYFLTINKLFVQPTKATAVVEERFLGSSPQDPAISGSYYWTQHWVKTALGWKLANITRTG